MTMHFRQSSSISSETSDDSIDSRLRTLNYKDPYNHDLVNRQKHDFSYSKFKRGRSDINHEDIAKRMFHIDRSRRIFKDLIFRNNDNEIIDSNFRRSRNVRISTDRNSSSLRNTRRSQMNMFNYNPQRNELNHSAIDIYQACQIIMIYRKDSLSSTKTDQIIIRQKQIENNQRIIVYKGYLKKGDTFSFKSRHLAEYSFDVKLYINGHVEAHLLSCCEYRYRQGEFRLSQSFIIEHVDKSLPCQRCQRREQNENEQNITSNTKRVSSDNQSLNNRQRTVSEERTSSDDEQIQERNINNHIQSTTSNDETQNYRENSTKQNEINQKEIIQSQEENETSQPDNNPSNDSPKSENEDNFSNIFHRMLMQRTTSNDSQNSGGLFQSLLSLLQNGLRRKEIHEPLPPRYEGNVENFVLILFNIPIELNLIHSIVNFIKTFDNIEELNSFIETLKCERIILIVNDPLPESIEDSTRFYSIYFLSTNVTQTNNLPNIRGHFPNVQTIFEEIKDECSIENDSFSIQSVSANETTNQFFCYSQLLKETLLAKDNEGDLKKDFLNFSRFHYKNNPKELNLIDQCEREFTIETSIWWFTRKTFIRKMLNRALRTQEIDILFKIRWIIQTLYNQIKENYLSTIVYRIHHLSSNELEKFKENHPDGLLSFGTFLDCKRNKPSRLEYRDGMETIRFQIKTNFAVEIEQSRYPDSTTEILLPFDIVYRIESIEENNDDDGHHHWWNINLISISKDNEQLKELTNEMRTEIESPVILIQFGKLLLSNNDYSHTDYLARLLFNDDSLKDNPTLLASLAALHHLLGSADNQKTNHRAARLQFEQSLKIFLSFIPEDNQILSATYNNIGSMYYQDDEHEQAIIYHKKALQCQLKSSSPDIESIATYSGNIGAVYLDQKNYDQALIHYKRSLQILQQSIVGGESLSIAMMYDRIASVYWRMDKPEEALSFYQQAVQLEIKYLPENDRKISVSYFNLSTACAKLNRLDDAIDYAEKSVQQLLKSVPPDHPEVKENTEQLEALRRKKWLQQLYQ